VSVGEAWEAMKKNNSSSVGFERKMTRRKITMGAEVMYSEVELFVVSLPDRSNMPRGLDYPSEAYRAMEEVLTRAIKKYEAHSKMWTANGVRATIHNGLSFVEG
jgi:hypothetical protein